MEEKFSFKKGYRGRAIFRISNIIFLSLVMVTMILPILKILSDSLDAAGTYGMNFIPKSPSLIAYTTIFGNKNLYHPFFISIYTTIIGTVIGLALTTLGAYVLIQKQMPGRNIFVWLIFFTMIFDGGLVPTYLLIRDIKLMNTLWAVILPLAINVYNLVLMKNFFEQIPESLFEAAAIDGCSPLRIFWTIVLPLSKPALASIGLFFAVEYYNHFFNFVMYITDTEKYNFQMKLRELVLSSASMPTGSEAVFGTTIKYAAVIISMLPPMILYPFCQRYFVTGVTMGAVKE
jgi:putative aldouronate transport system permease protein